VSPSFAVDKEVAQRLRHGPLSNFTDSIDSLESCVRWHIAERNPQWAGVGASIPSLALRNKVLIGLLIPRKHIARAEMEIGNKTDPQPNPQFGMSYMPSGYFGSPRGLVSCCKT
jgi:hypothetical protein